MDKSNKNSFAILIGILMSYEVQDATVEQQFQMIFPKTCTVWCA